MEKTFPVSLLFTSNKKATITQTSLKTETRLRSVMYVYCKVGDENTDKKIYRTKADL